ncbi:hypothetical protein [Pseudomonas aeruginosa]
MQDFGFALLLIGYVWSVASGNSSRQSNAQGIERRPPLALAALGAGLAYLGGGSVFG